MTGAAASSMKLTSRLWDRQDLEARLCHALDIAGRAIGRLAEHGYADPDDKSNDPVRPEKVISETAILLLAASTADSRKPVRTRVQNLAQLLIPHARSERMRLGVCLQPALALDYTSAHVCLKRIGYPDLAFDALLDEALKSQAAHGRERVPHRMLEQEWLREHCGTGTGRTDFRRRAFAGRYSALSFPLDLLACSRDDIYAFTHAMMYVTDFNLAPRRLPRHRKTILAEAEAALACCLDNEDYDLGGEVLLSWPLTGDSWSPAAVFAFHVLTSTEDAAGFLPAPITRLDRLNQLDGDSRTDYLLATAYHTIFVMGLLCAAALQPGRTPPRVVPARRAVRGSAGRILSTLDADGRKTHWRDQFAQLSDRERDALAGFLLIIALRRKTTERDYAAVAGLLREGHTLGLTDMPAGSQTAELLQRLATFSSLASRQSA
jgi:uncharacterized protein DUF6895